MFDWNENTQLTQSFLIVRQDLTKGFWKYGLVPERQPFASLINQACKSAIKAKLDVIKGRSEVKYYAYGVPREITKG